MRTPGMYLYVGGIKINEALTGLLKEELGGDELPDKLIVQSIEFDYSVVIH